MGQDTITIKKFAVKIIFVKWLVCIKNVHEFRHQNLENFWGLCKVRLAKFRGISRKTFYLHLKECEFRYNNRKENNLQNVIKNLQKITDKVVLPLFVH